MPADTALLVELYYRLLDAWKANNYPLITVTLRIAEAVDPLEAQRMHELYAVRN